MQPCSVQFSDRNEWVRVVVGRKVILMKWHAQTRFICMLVISGRICSGAKLPCTQKPCAFTFESKMRPDSI